MYGTYKHVFLTKSSSSERADGMFERLVLEPGIRLHYYNDQQYLSFEPRLRAKLNFDKVSFSFGSGMYAQNLMSAQSDRDVVNIFQGFLSAPEYGRVGGRKREKQLTTCLSFHHRSGSFFGEKSFYNC